ncbi:unnamed protein product [Caenorhabditis angaria]|uniref:Uncharacterized protein n=1 Tax=Caenorhabditis angaria TaxID=860376 RepID=A0A9P1IEI1_9PELO|nr:unnamed protein product [Caenorhabditis angaria]
MSDDKPARRIVDGKVGDQFHVARGYEGNWANAIGVPVSTPRGPAQEIPPGDGPVDTATKGRPDFRTVPKTDPVFPRNN